MKVLSVIQPYENKANTNGAVWVGIFLSNLLINDPRVDEVGLLTNLPDYSDIDKNIKLYELEYDKLSVNKSTIVEAVRLYREHSYDVIHLHMGTMTTLRWLKKVVPSDVNVVFTLHSSTILGIPKLAYGHIGRELINVPNIKFVAVSDYMTKIWRRFILDQSEVVKSPERKKRNYDHRKSPKYEGEINNLSVVYNSIVEYDIPIVPIENRKKQVLMCSRITPSKKVLETLEVVDTYGIPTVFIGDKYILGSVNKIEDDYIKDCIKLLNNSEYITWYPVLKNKEVRKLMSESCAVLHMTSNEACSLVLLESLSVGTPVIYGNCDSIIEMMNFDNNPDDLGVHLNYKPSARWSTRGKLINSAVHEIFDHPKDPKVISDYYYKYFSNKALVNNYIKVYDSFNEED